MSPRVIAVAEMFSSTRKPSEAESQFLDLIFRNNPTAWRRSDIMREDGEKPSRVREITGYDGGKRAIIRRIASSGEPIRYEGGWFGSSGITPELALTPIEAKDLYERISDQAKSWMRRELVRFCSESLSHLLSDIPRSSWTVSNRWATSDGEDLIGYLAVSEGIHSDGRNEFTISLEASIDQDPSKTHLKVTMERRGFTSATYLGSEREEEALTTICVRCGLEQFHKTEATLPPRPGVGDLDDVCAS